MVRSPLREGKCAHPFCARKVHSDPDVSRFSYCKRCGQNAVDGYMPAEAIEGGYRAHGDRCEGHVYCVVR